MPYSVTKTWPCAYQATLGAMQEVSPPGSVFNQQDFLNFPRFTQSQPKGVNEVEGNALIRRYMPQYRVEHLKNLDIDNVIPADNKGLPYSDFKRPTEQGIRSEISKYGDRKVGIALYGRHGYDYGAGGFDKQDGHLAIFGKPIRGWRAYTPRFKDKFTMWGDALKYRVKDYLGTPVQYGDEVFEHYELYAIVER